MDVLSYQLVLCRIAEEFWGVRTAYYYDLLQRQRLAKALQNSKDMDIIEGKEEAKDALDEKAESQSNGQVVNTKNIP